MNKFQAYLLGECGNGFDKGYENAWEEEFISNLEEKGDDYELSEKQNSILTRIHSTMADRGFI